MITQTGLVYSLSLAKPSLSIIFRGLLLLNMTILKFKDFMWLVIKNRLVGSAFYFIIFDLLPVD
jgi:hypothetical protein